MSKSRTLFQILTVPQFYASVVFLTLGACGIALAEEASEGRSLLEKKKWAEATISLKQRVARNPKDIPAVVDLAKALVYSGRREEALSVLVRAAENGPREERDKIAQRVNVFSRIFLTQATFQGYQEGLNFLAAQKYRPARERFERALEIEPDNVEVLLRVGQCLILDGDSDSAAERLRFARKLNPFEPQIKLWLGRALAQRGETKEAIQELRAAILGLRRSELAPVWFAEALIAAGQRTAAFQVLENDLKADPDHLSSLLMLVRLRSEASADSKDMAALLGVRKDLQAGLNRVERYGSPESPKSEGELGVETRNAEQMKSELQALVERVDAKIDSLSEENKGD